MKQPRNSVDFNDIQRNEQYHRKVPLISFHLNGHTLGFHQKNLKIRRAIYHSLIKSTPR